MSYILGVYASDVAIVHFEVVAIDYGIVAMQIRTSLNVYCNDI